MDSGGTGAQHPVLDEKRHGPGARRRLYLSGSGGKGVLHGQECVDAGPLRLDLRLSVPRVRSEGGVAGRQQELPGLHGAVLHQPGGGQPDVLHRHRRRQAAASAPLLLLRGLLCHRQRRVLRCYRRQGLPGAGPRGLRPDLEPEPGAGRRPHGDGPQDHPRDPLRPRPGQPYDLSEHHLGPAPGGPRAGRALQRAGRPVRG